MGPRPFCLNGQDEKFVHLDTFENKLNHYANHHRAFRNQCR